MSMQPQRIQMRRTSGWKKPDGVVYVGRPTVWGNPWRVGGKAHGALGPAEAVAEYERALTRGELRDGSGTPLLDRLSELQGRTLACWCDPGQPCHADVLLRYANPGAWDSAAARDGQPQPARARVEARGAHRR